MTNYNEKEELYNTIGLDRTGVNNTRTLFPLHKNILLCFCKTINKFYKT